MLSTILWYTCIQLPNISRYACYPFYFMGGFFIFFISLPLEADMNENLSHAPFFVSNMAPHNPYSQKISIHLVEEQNKGDCSEEKSVRQRRNEPKGKGH